jgi:hypothetical protein
MARIRNRLTGTEELFGTVAAAEAELKRWLQNFEARGCVVTEIDDEDGRSYRVSEPDGRPVGLFDVE